jgi:hypothetical protein
LSDDDGCCVFSCRRECLCLWGSKYAHTHENRALVSNRRSS